MNLIDIESVIEHKVALYLEGQQVFPDEIVDFYNRFSLVHRACYMFTDCYNMNQNLFETVLEMARPEVIVFHSSGYYRDDVQRLFRWYQNVKENTDYRPQYVFQTLEFQSMTGIYKALSGDGVQVMIVDSMNPSQCYSWSEEYYGNSSGS